MILFYAYKCVLRGTEWPSILRRQLWLALSLVRTSVTGGTSLWAITVSGERGRHLPPELGKNLRVPTKISDKPTSVPKTYKPKTQKYQPTYNGLRCQSLNKKKMCTQLIMNIYWMKKIFVNRRKEEQHHLDEKSY